MSNSFGLSRKFDTLEEVIPGRNVHRVDTKKKKKKPEIMTMGDESLFAAMAMPVVMSPILEKVN